MQAINTLADRLMRAVVNSAAGPAAASDPERACQIMREELKAFIAGEEYADERALLRNSALGGNLAWQSLVAKCCQRIATESDA